MKLRIINYIIACIYDREYPVKLGLYISYVIKNGF